MATPSNDVLKKILLASSDLPKSASNKVQKPLKSGDFGWKPSDAETRKDIERAKVADAEIRRALLTMAAASQRRAPPVRDSSEQKPPSLSPTNVVLNLVNGDDELINKSWYDLIQMRKGASKEDQDRLAPYEHRAWAREYTKDNPEAVLTTPGMSLAYNLLKALGLQSSRSEPSAKAVIEGTKGSIEGLGGYVRELITGEKGK
jgi:hypothetical protein